MVIVLGLLAACGGAVQSSDNSLSALSVSVGTLSPAFSPTVTAYGVTGPSGTTSATVTATTTSTKAKLQVRGVAATSGVASAPVSLNAGPNLIDIAVFAENGSVFIYDVTVTR